MQEAYDLGMDIGSVSVNLILLSPAGEVLKEEYRRHLGEPYRTALELIRGLEPDFSLRRCRLAAFTGLGGKLLAELLGGVFVNEVIAQARGTYHFHPEAQSIIDMGGEDAKLILVRNEGGHLVIADFAMNTLCAAGTGSFLDQQAHRLGYSIEEFSRLALKSTTPPRIAGRCSVFAKTDMIHLQQVATPDYEIIAGLCLAMARNLKSNIGKGKTLTAPVAFQGGVAHNLGVRQAFREVLNLPPDGLIIPPHFCALGALGAVLTARENPPADFHLHLKPLEDYLSRPPELERPLPPLRTPQGLAATHYDVAPLPEAGAGVEAYLGIDVGSISTNVVVIDKDMRVLAREYLMTAGRPLEAITEGLRRVGQKLAGRVVIMGAATTGSGRYLTGDFIGADVVRNEITAQATAAAAIDPGVDTIFEIGGQDSKFISLEHGAIVDFMMNKVCAAGTGSYLEEQAEKLGISIKEEFGRLALSGKNPVRLGERCTVFMESDLVHHQQRGARKEDLVAGLSYSIVQNYLNKVVEGRRIGNNIFYQGATAANQGIVAAFESVLGKKITVPPHHDVTGAIGAAILAMRERTWEVSRFKGFDLAEREYQISSFECQGCPNNCEIRRVEVAGEKPLFYGSRCEKYEVGRTQQPVADLPDLLKEREDWLFGPEPAQETGAPVIGLPRTMFFLELMPFFRAFFEELGYAVVYSQKTNKKVIRQGVESLTAEPCFPIKVAHGHILDLLEQGVKNIFLPSLIDLPHPHPEIRRGVVCPLAQTLAYAVPAALDLKAYGARLLTRPLYFGRGPGELRRSLRPLLKDLGVSAFRLNRAIAAGQAAQRAFYDRLRARGQEILNQLPADGRLMIIIGRPYNSMDPGMNLNLHRKLRQLGVLALPMDFLPLDDLDDTDEIKPMYWRYGQKILRAAQLIRQDDRLSAIYITNFGCGPDSFLQHFFRDIMAGKPYLEIEIDEHSADVGAITRLEAFLDSLKNVTPRPPKVRFSPYRRRVTKVQRRVYLPPMADQALALVAAFEACGAEAEVLPDSDAETLELGRRLTSGKECYPLILTTGDLAKMLKRPDFNPEKSAFFMPSGDGPCRFGQYHRYHRLVLDDLGYPQVPVYAPDQSETMYDEIGMVGEDFDRIAWRGVVAIDLLEKKLLETRPYERQPGLADSVYQHFLQKVYRTLRDRQELPPVLAEARRTFEDVAYAINGDKPVVGVVGEIYTRANRFANENAVREIEALGGQVWMPPIAEWLLYVNYTSKRRAKALKRYRHLLKIILKEWVQHKDEHRLAAIFAGSIRNLHEPAIPETLAMATGYLHPSFEGEAILSIGKSRDFYWKGAAGIVNIMPFSCMPGTVVNSLFKRFREEHDNIPFLNLAYDGQEQTHTRTRLEAFMYQVRQFHEQKNK